jgi:hypothetical protein
LIEMSQLVVGNIAESSNRDAALGHRANARLQRFGFPSVPAGENEWATLGRMLQIELVRVESARVVLPGFQRTDHEPGRSCGPEAA